MKQYQDITDPALAKALAHPLRSRILAALENRTGSPSEIAAELNAPLGVVSYHVRRLHALKFLKLVKRVPRRGAVEHYYTTVAGPFITNEAWQSTPVIVKHATVSAVLAEIGSEAADAVNAGGFDHDESHMSRIPVTVDEKGWRAIAAELDKLIPRIKKIEQESSARLKRKDHQDERAATIAMMLFSPAPKDTARSGRSGRSPRRRSGSQSASSSS